MTRLLKLKTKYISGWLGPGANEKDCDGRRQTDKQASGIGDTIFFSFLHHLDRVSLTHIIRKHTGRLLKTGFEYDSLHCLH